MFASTALFTICAEHDGESSDCVEDDESSHFLVGNSGLLGTSIGLGLLTSVFHKILDTLFMKSSRTREIDQMDDVAENGVDDKIATENALMLSTNPLLSELFDAYDVKGTGVLDAAEIIAVFEDWEVR